MLAIITISVIICGNRSAFMHTVVLMACRKIGHGEELFMDYRMSPHAPNRPAWYHDVDIETLNRIWDLKIPVPPQEENK